MSPDMRVVVTGASGNVGSRVVSRLLAHPQVDRVVGVVRRPPTGWDIDWVACDIGDPGQAGTLRTAMAGADAVIHLAWQIQPARDIERMRRTNVDGSHQVFTAALDAGVRTIVYASSVGAYAAGPKDDPVDESWPTDGVPSSTYSRHKSEVERILDHLEQAHPDARVVRFRPALIFQREAGSEVARYFLGPFLPRTILRRRLIPAVPRFDRLVFQAVHSDDVAAAFVRALLDDNARGAFNLAADPVIDADVLARALHARAIPTPLTAVRTAVDVAYRLRLQPTDAGWVDLAVATPVMSAERARTTLGWASLHSSTAALLELLRGMQAGAGAASPVLRPSDSVTTRAQEVTKAAAHGGAGAQNP